MFVRIEGTGGRYVEVSEEGISNLSYFIPKRMLQSLKSGSKNVLECTCFRFRFPKSIWSIHRMQEYCREPRIRNELKCCRDCAPNAGLNRRNKPKRCGLVELTTLVNEIACTFGITGEWRRKNDVTRVLNKWSVILT